jgi:hypothetical protein
MILHAWSATWLCWAIKNHFSDGTQANTRRSRFKVLSQMASAAAQIVNALPVRVVDLVVAFGEPRIDVCVVLVAALRLQNFSWM